MIKKHQNLLLVLIIVQMGIVCIGIYRYEEYIYAGPHETVSVVNDGCSVQNITYSCTLVQQSLCTSRLDKSPKSSCLGGELSWEICTDGKFLCYVALNLGEGSSAFETNCYKRGVLYRCTANHSRQCLFPDRPSICSAYERLCLDEANYT